jgi:hypothetical protein
MHTFYHAVIDIESLQNRLLKVCYVPDTSASLSRLLFLEWPLTVLMKQTMQGVAPLSSLYYLDVYACSELAFMLVCFAKGVIDYTFKMFETVDQHISGKFRSDNIK